MPFVQKSTQTNVSVLSLPDATLKKKVAASMLTLANITDEQEYLLTVSCVMKIMSLIRN